jgi:hypothetical protein
MDSSLSSRTVALPQLLLLGQKNMCKILESILASYNTVALLYELAFTMPACMTHPAEAEDLEMITSGSSRLESLSFHFVLVVVCLQICTQSWIGQRIFVLRTVPV